MKPCLFGEQRVVSRGLAANGCFYPLVNTGGRFTQSPLTTDRCFPMNPFSGWVRFRVELEDVRRKSNLFPFNNPLQNRENNKRTTPKRTKTINNNRNQRFNKNKHILHICFYSSTPNQTSLRSPPTPTDVPSAAVFLVRSAGPPWQSADVPPLRKLSCRMFCTLLFHWKAMRKNQMR